MRWLLAGSSCHLHSTDTPEFWEEEDEDDTGGSASVSITAAVSELEDGEEDDDEEEEAATVPAEHKEDLLRSEECRWRQPWSGLHLLFLKSILAKFDICS